jgi:hypothetical protein
MQVLPAFEGLDIHFAGTDPRLAHSSGLTGMTGLRDSRAPIKIAPDLTAV